MNRLSQKKRRLLRQLRECKNMVKGTLNAVCATCKRANCICKDPAGNLVFRLTYKDREQSTKIVYVPRQRAAIPGQHFFDDLTRVSGHAKKIFS